MNEGPVLTLLQRLLMVLGGPKLIAAMEVCEKIDFPVGGLDKFKREIITDGTKQMVDSVTARVEGGTYCIEGCFMRFLEEDCPMVDSVTITKDADLEVVCSKILEFRFGDGLLPVPLTYIVALETREAAWKWAHLHHTKIPAARLPRTLAGLVRKHGPNILDGIPVEQPQA